MTETLLDRIARVLGNVPIRHTDDGLPVYLGLSVRLELANAALAEIRLDMDRLRQQTTDLGGGQPARVLPAKFITDAMARIPDSLPPDFS
ncbi:hypothetical protein [Streptomyces sp. CPS1]